MPETANGEHTILSGSDRFWAGISAIPAPGVGQASTRASQVLALAKTAKGAKKVFDKYVRDFPAKDVKNYSAYFKSERDARNLARTKIGKNPVEVEPNKWRSADGKWQYRAKPGDVSERHIHIEELNPKTGEVLQNYHLRWE